jgi:hypothetical protein
MQKNRWTRALSSWIDAGAALFSERRRHSRLKADFTVSLSGPFAEVLAQAVDVNCNGVGIRSDRALPQGTLVFMRLTNLGLVGFAHVRHCCAQNGNYIVGPQFRDKLSRENDVEGNWEYRRLNQDLCRTWNEVAA